MFSGRLPLGDSGTWGLLDLGMFDLVIMRMWEFGELALHDEETGTGCGGDGSGTHLVTILCLNCKNPKASLAG